MADYLEAAAQPFAGVVLMVDSRLGFTDLDLQLLDFVAPRLAANGAVKLLVLLTKADKLNRREADQALAACQTRLAARSTEESDIGITLFSALKRRGVDDVAVLAAQLRSAGGMEIRQRSRPSILALPHGITLIAKATRCARRLLVFLHGFPEGAFVWDELLAPLRAATAASRPTCAASSARRLRRRSRPIAPSTSWPTSARSSPAGQPRRCAGGARLGRCGGLVAGGAASRTARTPGHRSGIAAPGAPLSARAARQPGTTGGERLHELCRPDAEALLAADDFARLWPFFELDGRESDGSRD